MELGNSWALNILVAATTLLGILYYYLTSNYDYWKKRGVPYAEPKLFFGNIKDQLLMKKPLYLILHEIYKKTKGERFVGCFAMRTPMLIIKDPELVERVLVKDFSHFQNRDLAINIDLKTNPLFRSLFYLSGLPWRNLRHRLTYIFATRHLKIMLEGINNSGDMLLKQLEKISDKGEAINPRHLIYSYATDLATNIFFSLQFLPQSPEAVKHHRIAHYLTTLPFSLRVRIVLGTFFGKLTKSLKMRVASKEVTDYYFTLVKTTMDFRKKNNIRKNDFLQLLMDLKDQKNSRKRINSVSEHPEEAFLQEMDYVAEESGLVLSDEEIMGQAFVFLDESAASLARSIEHCLVELAINRHVQDRLQQEVDTVLDLHGGMITHDSLKEMKYLDLVLQEKNRKYTGVLQRVCKTPYQIPGTDVIIEKGVRVFIPVHSIHLDPEYYPDPERFIPERFEGNNYHNSGKYLPFGDGPRMCIAMRLAIMELKVTIAKVMSQYSVTLDPRTTFPLECDPKSSYIYRSKSKTWINFKKRVATT